MHAVNVGYEWQGLSKGSIVVDVGGGVGLYSLCLARAYDHLNFVVQDREAVIVDAVKVPRYII